MQLHNAINNVFVQLNTILQLLSAAQYTQKGKLLSNATIGQHVRHIIELFICLNKGYETGIVNYDSRERNQQIETSKQIATSLLKEIYEQLDKPDKSLMLEACYDDNAEKTITIATNYYREIAYNLEHAVHHMALIRVGVTEVSNIKLPEGFGVASSTIKYRKESAC
ncbi:MAG: hypothetical protein ABI921_04210 [Panacibacter sp.]